MKRVPDSGGLGSSLSFAIKTDTGHLAEPLNFLGFRAATENQEILDIYVLLKFIPTQNSQ